MTYDEVYFPLLYRASLTCDLHAQLHRKEGVNDEIGFTQYNLLALSDQRYVLSQQ